MAQLVGWVVAAGCAALVLCDHRRLASRREQAARACHELRGPLTAAALAVHAAGREGEVARPRVEAVELELQRAAVALDDLCAALAGERPDDAHEHVDVAALLITQLEAWSAAAAARGRELRLSTPPAGVVVHGDRVRLAQVTANVVANALEHGRGAVEVGARVVAGRVRIEVADGGSGLPRPVAELARRPRGGRGARGRGLAIASDIVARHGGRLDAIRDEAGARMAIDLPSVAASQRAGSERPATRTRAVAA